ncbi:cadherin repeat domain-containing protein, partial [Microvirga alba]
MTASNSTTTTFPIEESVLAFADNHAPTDLKLGGETDGISVVEGETIVGDLTAWDEDGDTEFEWSFDGDAEDGGDAGGWFVIENGQIKLAPGKALEFDGPDAVKTYKIYVKASDGNPDGVSEPKMFTITVTNDPSDDPVEPVNHAPTDLALSNTTINESEDPVTVGTLSAA